MIVNLIAGAGNETTTRLIGFTGKVLADHPDQRREIAEDRALVPQAIEELLRYEAPSPVQGRYVTRDTEHHGHTVPEGSAMLLLVASANRDPNQFPGCRPLRHPPQDLAQPHLRLRHPLLPRRRAGPARGSGRARRGAAAVPGVGDRLGSRGPGPHLHRARLGVAPRRHSLSAAVDRPTPSRPCRVASTRYIAGDAVPIDRVAHRLDGERKVAVPARGSVHRQDGPQPFVEVSVCPLGEPGAREQLEAVGRARRTRAAPSERRPR